jgi:mono/diheme cytochrome c family protein
MKRAFALAMLLAACAAQLAPPTAEDAARAQLRWPGTTIDELARGRALYVEHCSGCHRIYRPDAYPADRWPKLVGDMAERSKLDAAQADQVVRYLVTTSRR